MNTEDNNQEAGAPAQESAGEEKTGGEDNLTVSKKDYEKLNQTLGSLKRELKDLKKPKEEPEDTSKTTKSDDRSIERLEKLALRTAGLTHQDDVDLAKTTAKKWNMDIEEVLLDEDFKAKLERQQTSRGNVEATSGVKGGSGSSGAKNTPEYWIAKDTLPTPKDIPDRVTRMKVINAFRAQSKVSKKYYNE